MGIYHLIRQCSKLGGVQACHLVRCTLHMHGTRCLNLIASYKGLLSTSWYSYHSSSTLGPCWTCRTSKRWDVCLCKWWYVYKHIQCSGVSVSSLPLGFERHHDSWACSKQNLHGFPLSVHVLHTAFNWNGSWIGGLLQCLVPPPCTDTSSLLCWNTGWSTHYPGSRDLLSTLFWHY